MACVESAFCLFLTCSLPKHFLKGVLKIVVVRMIYSDNFRGGKINAQCPGRQEPQIKPASRICFSWVWLFYTNNMNIFVANMGHLRIFYRHWINYVCIHGIWLFKAHMCGRGFFMYAAAAARETDALLVGEKNRQKCRVLWKRTSFLAAFCFISHFLSVYVLQ